MPFSFYFWDFTYYGTTILMVMLAAYVFFFNVFISFSFARSMNKLNAFSQDDYKKKLMIITLASRILFAVIIPLLLVLFIFLPPGNPVPNLPLIATGTWLVIIAGAYAGLKSRVSLVSKTVLETSANNAGRFLGVLKLGFPDGTWERKLERYSELLGTVVFWLFIVCFVLVTAGFFIA